MILGTARGDFIEVNCEYYGSGTVEIPLDFYNFPFFAFMETLPKVQENAKKRRQEHESKAAAYIEANFTHIYEEILKALFRLQTDNIVKYEICNFANGGCDFERITFRDYKEIHGYVGIPAVTVINPCIHRELFPVFSVWFGGKDCRISVEHGITAIFVKNKLVDLGISDYVTMLANAGYENAENREKWAKTLMNEPSIDENGFWAGFR